MRLFYIITAMSLLLAATNALAVDMVSHKDMVIGYSINYPKAWSQRTVRTKNTVFSVGNNEDDGCSVNVQYKAELANRDVRDFIKSVAYSKATHQAVFRKTWPNAVVLDSGEMAVGSLPAYYTIIEFSHAAIDTPVRMLSVVTINKAKAYTIGCLAYKAGFDKKLPLFKQIATSFSLL